MKTADYEPKMATPSETIEMPVTPPPYENVESRAESTAATIGWMVWERRRRIGKKLGIFLAIVTIVVFFIPNSYESTTTLMPPDTGDIGSALALGSLMSGGDSSGGSGGGSALSGLAGSLLGVKNTGDIFIGVLQSQSVQDKLIDRFDLRRVYWTKYYETARDELESRTTVTADRKSGIITITVSDRQAARAQQLAQAYVEELDRLVAKVSTSAARRERIFLEDRLKQVKRDLDQASLQLGEFSSKNSTMDLDDQAKAMLEAQGSFVGELVASKSELASLQQIYSDNNVRVKSLKARIAELNNQMAKFGGTPGGSTETIPGLESPTLRALPLIGAQYADYYRRAKMQEKVYEVLTQEYELAKVQEAKDIPPVRVLDPPNLAERKSWPPRSRIVLIAAALGCFVVVGWVWAEYRWERMDTDHPRKQTLLELKGLATTITHAAVESTRAGWRRLRKKSAPNVTPE